MKLGEIREADQHPHGPYGWDNDELAIDHHFLRHCVKGVWTVDKNVVNVNGNVRVPDSYPAEELPVQFGIVTGNFTVAGATRLKSLVGCPKKVGGYFNCDKTNVLQLHGGPQWVGDSYFCGDTKINTLAGCPKYIGAHFNTSGCRELRALHTAPEQIGGNWICINTAIKSFSNIHRMIKLLRGGTFKFSMNVNYSRTENTSSAEPLPTNLLGLLLIPGIKVIEFKGGLFEEREKYEAVQELFNDFLKHSKVEDLIDLQHKMIDMGLAAQAKM